jgi:nucleosome binding factor SPN SPT16 subunit
VYENLIKVLFAKSIELTAEDTTFLREEMNTLMYVVAFYMAKKRVCFHESYIIDISGYQERENSEGESEESEEESEEDESYNDQDDDTSDDQDEDTSDDNSSYLDPDNGPI